MKTFTINLDLGIVIDPFDKQEIIEKYKDRSESIAKAALVICTNHNDSIFKEQTTSNFNSSNALDPSLFNFSCKYGANFIVDIF